MKKFLPLILALLILIGGGAYFFNKNIGTVNIPGTTELDEDVKETESLPGFELPAGFSLHLFARGVEGARAIEIDPKGRVLVSQTSEGKITALIDKDNDNVSDKENERKVLATGLKRPHGMAFQCDAPNECFLYIAEQDAISRFPYDVETPSLGAKEKLVSIASSITDRHYTRSLLFLPAPNRDTLLISVGSSCDVCHEENSDRASIISYNIKTGVKEVYARGLRNAVFMALNPGSGKVYATEMGRDNLGDDLPPDEINIIEKGKNYGWPICFSKNVHDSQFDKNTYIRNPCMEPFETPSFVDLQAHSAPLGLAFIPDAWGEEYRDDMLVAYHGSWNRSVPTGYKIARIKMNAEGEYLGTDDFVSGWLKDGNKTGRPVDIEVLKDGTAYITDDSSGMIYRLLISN